MRYKAGHLITTWHLAPLSFGTKMDCRKYIVRQLDNMQENWHRVGIFENNILLESFIISNTPVLLAVEPKHIQYKLDRCRRNYYYRDHNSWRNKSIR